MFPLNEYTDKYMNKQVLPWTIFLMILCVHVTILGRTDFFGMGVHFVLATLWGTEKEMIKAEERICGRNFMN